MHACKHVCMYACMHVGLYACMYLNMYLHTYACMYVCMHVCMCVYRYMSIYIYIFIYLYLYACMYACISHAPSIRTNTDTRVCVCVLYIYVYACTQDRCAPALHPPNPNSRTSCREGVDDICTLEEVNQAGQTLNPKKPQTLNRNGDVLMLKASSYLDLKSGSYS